MNIIYLASDTFVARELTGALERGRGFTARVFRVPRHPLPSEAERVVEAMRPFLPAVVLSLNDAGYDLAGRLAELLRKAGAFIVNWYHDYPFYEEIHMGRRICPSPERLDFVSERSFLPEMRERGFKACFLPLATDPRFFNMNGCVKYERDIAFVGNSSLQLMDSVVTEEVECELEKVTELIAHLRTLYTADPTVGIRDFLLRNPSLWEETVDLPKERFLFAVEWLIGFFYRRDFIAGIASCYAGRFTCFGDPYWKYYLGNAPVCGDARYYDNLCRYYRSTRVNLNVNRIQIRSSVNQRIFDCKASGAFLLTERREDNRRFFKTEGPDRELVEFDSESQCRELIDYFLEHEQEREAIAGAGRAKVLNSHTYDHRVAELVSVCRKDWRI
ncbi:MAG: glycosyltransferase [Chitinivibrionales bacterium]|nr:glycosyltransferase [Chitinivibrionales bacterium]MBD3357976.1 glycosyltransferase [Chitinivibrionales bacterium]